jgi:RNA polymerase sigma-70 factor (ECF subfamily)
VDLTLANDLGAGGRTSSKRAFGGFRGARRLDVTTPAVDYVKEPGEVGPGCMAWDTGRRHQDRFATVILPHLDAAHNLARWLMRDAETAEDVLQDAMVRALTYFPGFKGINPRGWLLQIVRNTAYASMNLNRGIQLVSITMSEEDRIGAIADLPSEDDDPETALIKSRDRRHVRQLIAALPVELRETLVLRELEELSYKGIAEVTRTPIGTVMSRLWRARSLLSKFKIEETKPSDGPAFSTAIYRS